MAYYKTKMASNNELSKNIDGFSYSRRSSKTQSGSVFQKALDSSGSKT